MVKGDSTVTSKDYNVQIGENIRTYRKLQHMTQQELADKLHKSLACISKYEKGIVSLDIYTLHEIAGILGLPLQMLLPKDDEPGLSNQAAAQLPDFFRRSPIYAYCIRSNRNEIVAMAIDVQPAPLQTTIYCDLRDPADYPVVKAMYDERFPHTPKVITLAPVCRPGWLIEMECMGVKAVDNGKYEPF